MSDDPAVTRPTLVLAAALEDLHARWGRAIEGRFYVRDDKRLWTELDRRLRADPSPGEAAVLLGYARGLEEIAVRGTTVWPAGDRPPWLR